MVINRPYQKKWVEYHLANSRGGRAFDFWLEIALWRDLITQISRSVEGSAIAYSRNNLVTS